MCVREVYHSKMCSYAVVSRALEQAPVNHTYNAKCVYFCTYLPQKCLVFNTYLSLFNLKLFILLRVFVFLLFWFFFLCTKER